MTISFSLIYFHKIPRKIQKFSMIEVFSINYLIYINVYGMKIRTISDWTKFNSITFYGILMTFVIVIEIF